MRSASAHPSDTTTRNPIETILDYVDRYNKADFEGRWPLQSPDFTRVGSSEPPEWLP